MGLKPISEIKADLGIEPNGRVQKFLLTLVETIWTNMYPKTQEC